MKAILLGICVVSICSCSKRSELTPAETPPAAGTAAPVAVESPTLRRNLAPEGTYFLLQRISITTDSGVIGDPPGTKVTLVKAGPPARVTDGHNEFDVDPSQITNDLDIATQVFYADRSVQSAIKAMSDQQAREYSKQQASQQKAVTDYLKSQPASYAQPISTFSSGGNPLDKSSYNQRQRVGAPDSRHSY